MTNYPTALPRLAGLTLAVTLLAVPLPSSAQPQPQAADVQPSDAADQPPPPAPPPPPPPATQPPEPSETQSDTPAGSVMGVGGQLALSGFGGLQILYQTDRYHIDGLISFFDAADTTISVGGRFFYHARKSERADFSLGTGIGLTHVNDADLDILHVEAVGQIRFFVAPAVVISATMGVALQTLDGDVVGLGADVLGGAGITYLFY